MCRPGPTTVRLAGPFSAIHDLTSGCVFLKWPKEEIEQRGWDRRPDYLNERT
jgi:hypothetical protein